ncbi:MAG: protein kinase [Planctomycetota bacterium]|nr:protein kinase [Planctomycetota bacterium]
MKLTCPKCAQAFEADGKAAKAVCPHCGAAMPVPALAETITQRAAVSTPRPPVVASEAVKPETTAKETSPPRQFARYEIIKEIGRGAFGIVYRARDPQLGRDVALKVLIAGAEAGESLIKRFHAEAQAAAKLRHPNIVPIHDVGIHDGKHYFTAEFIEGATLEKLLKERLPTTQIVRLMTEIASAIQHAQEHGIVHRDIKPGNVLIDASGRAMVTDFGLARNVEIASSLTRSDDVVGTPAYMSPEQAAGRTAEVEERSDVYALGVLLYEMLTGRPPFQSNSLVALLRAVIEDEPEPPRKLNPKADRDLETICLKCLEKEKARRYRTAAALVEDLKRFTEGEPLAACPPSFTYRWRKRLWKHRAWTLGLTAAAVALIVALGLGLGLFDRLARFAAGWELVVNEDFSSGVLPEGWEVVQGKAEVADGALVAEGARTTDPTYPFGQFIVLFPVACPEAVRLEYDAWFPADVELAEKATDLSCFLHCDRDHVAESGYMLQFGSMGNKCSSACRKDAELLRNTAPQALITPGRRHHIVAEHASEYLTLTVDGHPVLRLRDFFPLTGGRAGLYSFREGAHFDNVKLWRRKKALDVSSLAVPDTLFLKADYKGAIAEYDAIHASHASAPEGRLALYKSGLARMAFGDLKGARLPFESLVNSDLRGWAHIGLAEVEARSGRGEEAVEELMKAENAGDAEVVALVRANAIRIAFEALSRADVSVATPLLKKARQGLLDWELARLAQTVTAGGRPLAGRGEYYAAIAFQRAVVAVFPDLRDRSASASKVIGSWLHLAGRNEEALKALAALAKEYPEERGACATARVVCGHALTSMGLFADATKAFDSVETDYPDVRSACAEALRSRASALRYAGKYEQSLKVCDAVSAKYPDQRADCATALLESSIARLLLNDRGGAEADWRKLLRDYASDSRGAALLASFFLGEIGESVFLDDLKREERMWWNDVASYVAEKYEAEGNLPEAARWYRKCLELTVGDDWPAVLARKRLKEIEEKLKAPADAPAKADGR